MWAHSLGSEPTKLLLDSESGPWIGARPWPLNVMSGD
jgi:hypothetical protein